MERRSTRPARCSSTRHRPVRNPLSATWSSFLRPSRPPRLTNFRTALRARLRRRPALSPPVPKKADSTHQARSSPASDDPLRFRDGHCRRTEGPVRGLHQPVRRVPRLRLLQGDQVPARLLLHDGPEHRVPPKTACYLGSRSRDCIIAPPAHLLGRRSASVLLWVLVVAASVSTYSTARLRSGRCSNPSPPARRATLVRAHVRDARRGKASPIGERPPVGCSISTAPYGRTPRRRRGRGRTRLHKNLPGLSSRRRPVSTTRA